MPTTLFEWLRPDLSSRRGRAACFPMTSRRGTGHRSALAQPRLVRRVSHRRAPPHAAAVRDPGAEQQLALFDPSTCIATNRPCAHSSSGRPAAAFHPRPYAWDRCRPAVQMVESHEGGDSARLARLADAPAAERDRVARQCQPAGRLHAATGAGASRDGWIWADPATASAWTFWSKRRRCVLAKARPISFFWQPTPTSLSAGIQSVISSTWCATTFTPGLASTPFYACADPAFWQPVFSYADLACRRSTSRSAGIVPASTATTGAMPPLVWLELLGQRGDRHGPGDCPRRRSSGWRCSASRSSSRLWATPCATTAVLTSQAATRCCAHRWSRHGQANASDKGSRCRRRPVG